MNNYANLLFGGIILLFFVCTIICFYRQNIEAKALRVVSVFARIVVSIFFAGPTGRFLSGLFVGKIVGNFFINIIPDFSKVTNVHDVMERLPAVIYSTARFLDLNIADIVSKAFEGGSNVTICIVDKLSIATSLVVSKVLGFIIVFSITGVLLFTLKRLLSCIAKKKAAN